MRVYGRAFAQSTLELYASSNQACFVPPFSDHASSPRDSISLSLSRSLHPYTNRSPLSPTYPRSFSIISPCRSTVANATLWTRLYDSHAMVRIYMRPVRAFCMHRHARLAGVLNASEHIQTPRVQCLQSGRHYEW